VETALKGAYSDKSSKIIKKEIKNII